MPKTTRSPKAVRRRLSASEAEWAWAAGLFEGEGTITTHNGGRRGRLGLKMTDEDVVRRFAGIVGGRVHGPYQYQQPDGHVRKPFWHWNSDGTDIAEIMSRFRPWLGGRRRRRIDDLHLLDQGVLPGITDVPIPHLN